MTPLDLARIMDGLAWIVVAIIGLICLMIVDKEDKTAGMWGLILLNIVVIRFLVHIHWLGPPR